MSPRLFGAFTPVRAYTNTLEFSLSHTYTLTLCVLYTHTSRAHPANPLLSVYTRSGPMHSETWSCVNGWDVWKIHDMLGTL